MATIKPIEGRTVHQIQSGQVIVDLCSVVKELVENSLDAGATSIDVRFKNQGLESIEVQDNGDGISPQNYESLALKHHTSKLSTYDDLTTLETFGFRGEALSSLCALSKFSVITCMAKDAPKGSKLDFEVSGQLKMTSVVAAQKGTTVCVENLFNNLPVRRRELERNIKREWNRVVGHLGQYACIQTGIKFSVTQQAGKGKRTTLFSTKGNQTTRENIVNVFGAKTMTALIAMDLNLELELTSGPSQRWSTQDDGGKKNIRIVGHISRPASGEGRQTPDRQMFFVNSRPCLLPQVAKAFNEVYKAYNGTQSPFIFANIELDAHLYDVNVSPDKRTILLHDQHRMLENLKEKLIELFESQDYRVPISQLPTQRQTSHKQLNISRDIDMASSSKSPQIPSRLVGDGESQDETQSSRTDRKVESNISGTPKGQMSRANTVSRASMGRDQRAISLISNWVGRNAQDRAELEKEPSRPKAVSEKPAYPPNEKQKLVEATDVPESSVLLSPFTLIEASHKPSEPIKDSQEERSETQGHQGSEQELRSPTPEAETPIPAVRSPTKPVSSIANFFAATPRSHRPPADIATITIGDHTTTSSIGTPFPKRARVEITPNAARQLSRSRPPTKPLPSFGKSLSQRFAAPGTAGQPEEIEDEEQEMKDGVQDPPQSSDALDADLQEAEEAEEDEEQREDVSQNQEASVVKQEEGPHSTMLTLDVEEEGKTIDETQTKFQEEARVQQMIEEVENTAAVPSQENLSRANSMLRGGSKKKESTLNLVREINTIPSKIGAQIKALQASLSQYQISSTTRAEESDVESEKAEEKLSLIISKSDFAKMKIIGQFNLGFILASRSSRSKTEGGVIKSDDMFIIDQHASDEKYNFERLQATTIVQSQRLVYPKTLDLTAMEEEVVFENLSALETNGFIVSADQSGNSPIGQRCQLVALPLSRDTAFSLTDLEELIALLADNPAGQVPRPAKVRKMFAMRACRSSIMIGKSLTGKQMGRVVKHLGELDKPWNCPHGRPTMRHLCGLGVWDELGWRGDVDKEVDWGGWGRGKRGGVGNELEGDELEGNFGEQEGGDEFQEDEVMVDNGVTKESPKYDPGDQEQLQE